MLFLHYNFYFGHHFLSTLWKDVFPGIKLESKYKLNAKFRRKLELVVKIIKSYTDLPRLMMGLYILTNPL